jgi:hypothetical protein
MEKDTKAEVAQAPQVANDLEARVKGFNEELMPLLGKYKLGLGGQAFLTTDGRIAARPFIFDDSQNPEFSEKKEGEGLAVADAVPEKKEEEAVV